MAATESPPRQGDMEACFYEAVRNLSTNCRQDDKAKCKESISIATMAILCLKKDYGSSRTFKLLKTSAIQSVQEAASLLDIQTPSTPLTPSQASSTPLTPSQASSTPLTPSQASSTPLTPSQASSTPLTPSHTPADTLNFWPIAHHLLSQLSDPSSLRSLQRYHSCCSNLLSCYSHCTRVALSPAHCTELQSALCECMNQWLLKSVSERDKSVESFVRSSAVCYIFTDHGETSKQGRTSEADRSLEGLLVTLVSTGPKLVHQTYQECLSREELQDGCTHRAPTGGVILKSVGLLADSLLLLATIVKRRQALQDIVIETSLRLLNHCLEQLVQRYRLFPKDLPLKSLYVVLSSALHLDVVFKFLLTQLDLQSHGYPDLLSTGLCECCDEMREGIVSYHVRLCQTSLLHDRESNDWKSSQPFFENERCSFTIQMWHYHMLGLEHDLCSTLPESCLAVSRKIVGEVLSGTLTLLASRYSLVSPSHRRVKQARGDILTILLTVSHFLYGSSNLSLHSSCSVIHASCCSLIQTLVLALSPLPELTHNLAHLGPTLTEGEDSYQDRPSSGEWLSFLNICGFSSPLSDTLYGHSQSTPNNDAGDVISSEARVLLLIHSYQRDTASWPNLLQLLCEDVSLSVRLCSCEGGEAVIPHVVYILANCYHSPLALTRVYQAYREFLEGPSQARAQIRAGPNLFLQATEFLIIDELQEYVLLGATNFQFKQDNKVDELERLLAGLLKQVSALSAPLLGFLKALADIESDKKLPLGQRVAKVVGRILGAWLTSLLPRLSDPLTSIVSTYSTALTYSLRVTTPEQGPSDLNPLPPQLSQLLRQHSSRLLDVISRSEELFLFEEPQVGVVTIEEHQIVAEMMENNVNARQSLKVIGNHLSSSHHSHPSHDPLAVYNVIGGEGGVPIATIMETTEALNWNELFRSTSFGHMTRKRVASLVARRWEFQTDNKAILQEDEATLVQTVRTILEDDSSV